MVEATAVRDATRGMRRSDGSVRRRCEIACRFGVVFRRYFGPVMAVRDAFGAIGGGKAPNNRLTPFERRVVRDIAAVREVVQLQRDGVEAAAVSGQLARVHEELAAVMGVMRTIIASSREPSPQIRHDIASLMSAIDDPWIKHVAEVIVENTATMLRGLGRPDATYRGEFELYRALTAEMDSTRPGDTVFAVCGAKSWDADSVRQYLEANERAAKRGVDINRIFCELEDGRAVVMARRQAAYGIRARLLRRTHLAQLSPEHRIPLALGVAIFNGKSVFVHSGLGPSAYACRFDCADLANVIRSQFVVAERLSDSIDDDAMASNENEGNVVHVMGREWTRRAQ
jgi:hypothetical protein